MTTSRIVRQRRRQRFLRKVFLLLACLSLVAFFSWKALKDRPSTDPRLLGTWIPAVEMTLDDMEQRKSLSESERQFWSDSLSSINVRYYPEYIAVKHKSTGQRIPYRVTDREDYSVVLVKMENGKQVRQKVYFNKDYRLYWTPLTEGSEVRKYFRRISGHPPEPKKTFEERMRKILGIREA
jgi:hypothetical protein